MYDTCEAVYAHDMATAHLIIKCIPHSEQLVIEKLRRMGNVKEIHKTVGEYDIMVKIEAESMNSLKKIISWEILKNDKIQSVTTLICMNRAMCAVTR